MRQAPNWDSKTPEWEAEMAAWTWHRGDTCTSRMGYVRMKHTLNRRIPSPFSAHVWPLMYGSGIGTRVENVCLNANINVRNARQT